jgi:hypothetical protein
MWLGVDLPGMPHGKAAVIRMVGRRGLDWIAGPHLRMFVPWVAVRRSV